MTADSRIRRAIIRGRHLLIFGLMGVVMSYVVAWGLTFVDRADRSYAENASIRTVRWWTFSYEELFCALQADWTELPSAREFMPWWAYWITVPSPPRPDGMVAYAVGWPLRCAWHDSDLSSGGLLGGEYVSWRPLMIATTDDWQPNLWGSGIVLSVDPIWPGLLLNTAFYGAILWLLWFGTGMLRRGIRRRRRLCVKCGYDLRGAVNGPVCPECGGVSR